MMLDLDMLWTEPDERPQTKEEREAIIAKEERTQRESDAKLEAAARFKQVEWRNGKRYLVK